MKSAWTAASLGLAVWLSGCAGTGRLPDAELPLDASRLPAADLTLQIAGLGPCTDQADRRVSINRAAPVTVLVHGCFGSAGKFRKLAQVLAFQGQQTACFSYDDRDSLDVSAARLATAIDQLAGTLDKPDLTLLGHSQGGLVARRAVASAWPGARQVAAELRLVTISAPFAGIDAAATCGNTVLRVATLGLLDLTCRAISGDKWHEITARSSFIQQPGELQPAVRQHLKIATDEAQTCRRLSADGRCLKDDYVFSLREQYFPPVDRSPVVRAIDLKAGHAGVVGETGEVPQELIALLQREDVIRPVEAQRRGAFERFLRVLYAGRAGVSQSARFP